MQGAFDTTGNTQLQATGGAGVSAGGEAAGTIVIAIYPGMENVYESIHPVGMSVNIGGGVGLEGHAYMTYTKDMITFNIYDWLLSSNCDS